nr:protein POLYCHOME-like [Ipomoea batatas]GMD85717.1 protein POLYCHOME-like [Ipomoea batatas]
MPEAREVLSRPLQDITNITRAYERRREFLREIEPGTPLLRDVATPSARLERPPSVDKLAIKILNENVQDWEFLTPLKKLLNSIDRVERVFKEELQKLQRTPSARKAQREKRVKTLMPMR